MSIEINQVYFILTSNVCQQYTFAYFKDNGSNCKISEILKKVQLNALNTNLTISS